MLAAMLSATETAEHHMPVKKRYAGPYRLLELSRVGPSPVKSIETCLGYRKIRGINRFYMLKMLTTPSNIETNDTRQGKMLLHTEYSLLSLIKHLPGIIKYHHFFKDEVERVRAGNSPHAGVNQEKITRYCLVLDCLVSHDYDSMSSDYINLQHYVIKERQLDPYEALIIFRDIVSTVYELHQMNVVHRDLKLGNMILNRRNNKIILTNFCLGKYLINENDLLTDQRGSPAYISPEVLGNEPYRGKPSDIWALGVVLFTMLYGQFPFYDQQPHLLFKKIKDVKYSIPEGVESVPEGASDLLKKLLNLNPDERLTAEELLSEINHLIRKCKSTAANVDQIVPEVTLHEAEDNSSHTNTQLSDQDSCKRTVSEFEKRLTELERELQDDVQSVPRVPSYRSSLDSEPPVKRCTYVPAVRRLSEDARPLSCAELMLHQDLILEHQTPPPTQPQTRVTRINKESQLQMQLRRAARNAETPCDTLTPRSPIPRTHPLVTRAASSLTRSTSDIPPSTPAIGPSSLSWSSSSPVGISEHGYTPGMLVRSRRTERSSLTRSLSQPTTFTHNPQTTLSDSNFLSQRSANIETAASRSVENLGGSVVHRGPERTIIRQVHRVLNRGSSYSSTSQQNQNQNSNG